MANGYIGKISAVVTANTSDLSRKLRSGKDDVDRFVNGVNASLERLEKSGAEALNKLFTPLQNLERKFKTALEFNFRTEESVAKLRQIVSVSEGINKPLAQAATAFSRLTLEVQGSFLPALNRAQDSVLLLNRKVNETGSVSAKAFGIVERIVARTASAIQRLGEAQRLVASGPNANSLALAAPRVSQTLQASAAARQQAAGLPASELADGRVARQVGNLSAVENRIAEVQGRIEALQLRPKVDTVQLEAARKELDRLLAGAERIRAGIQVRVDAQKAIADTASLSQKLDQLQENANFSITGTPQNLRQVEAELGRVLGQFDSLNEAQRESLGAQFGAQFSRVADALRSGNLPQAIQDFQLLEASVKLAANETERLARASKLLTVAPDQPPPPSPRTALGDRLSQAGADRIRGLTGSTNIDSTPVPGVFNQQAQRDIDALASRVGAVRQQLETLPNSLRSQFIPALQQAQQQLIALQNSPGATAAQIDRAAASVKNLETQAKRAAASLQLPAFSDFMDDFSVQRAVGELNAFQQILARVGAVAGGQAAQAYETYRARLQEAIRTGTTGLPLVRAELEKLQVEAAKAAAATGKISFSAALRSIQRGGDIARGAFGNLNLAVQQGIFAIDDFTSVTGGLDQRIRAAANNISQLAFLLGGTWGLAAGVAISVTAQLAVGFAKWATGTEEAERRQKKLEAAIKQVNSALERQLEITNQLAEAYKKIADSIGEAGTSERGRGPRERRRELDELRQQQLERRREAAAASNPAVGRSRARVAEIEEQLQTETNFGARRRLEREREQLRRRIESDLDRAEIGAQVEIDTARRRSGGSTERARADLVERRAGAQSRLAGLFRQLEIPGITPAVTRQIEARIERLSETLAQIEVALLKLGDEAALGSITRAQGITDQVARAQADVSRFDAPSRLQAQLDDLARAIEEAAIDATSADSATASAAQASLEGLQAFAEQLSRSAIVVGEFAGVIESAAGQLARTVEQELTSRGESVRRQANESEARFGGGDERTQLLRNAQDRIEDARRRAQAERQQIDAAIVRRQTDLQTDLQFGLGDPRAVELAGQIRDAEAQAADAAAAPSVRAAAEVLAASLRDQLQNVLGQDAEISGLRDRANEVDVAAQREQQQIEQAIRGRELSLTPAQRAAESLSSDIEAIRQFYGQRAEATTGLVDFEAQNAAIARVRDEALRAAAPAIFALSDEVANSLLQGPSRAALGATDASTVEGQMELNRLLRGDDQARDVNLAELERQSKLLEEIAKNTADQIPVAP